jgi:hypothetical protein
MIYQLMSLAGAAMILAAYVAYQRGRMGREDRLYNLLNFLGAALLAWVAIEDQRWGFIILESTWALLSLPALIRPPAKG